MNSGGALDETKDDRPIDIIREKYLRRVATHEAGHAVMALRLGIAFDEVLLNSGAASLPKNVDGCVKISGRQVRRTWAYDRSARKWTGDAAQRLFDYKQVMVCFAGEIAEGLIYGEVPARVRDIEGCDDMDARKFLSAHHNDARELETAYAKLQVRAIATIYGFRRLGSESLKNAIEAIAGRLLARGRLSFEECRNIYRQATRKTKPPKTLLESNKGAK